MVEIAKTQAGAFMIAPLLLILLLIVFVLGCVAITLLQFNIIWQNSRNALRKKQATETVIKTKPLSLQVVSRQELSERHFSVRLNRVDGESLENFLPGQYLTLMAPNPSAKNSVSNGLLKRCYSLASWHKKAQYYELAIQCEINGQVSTWLHRHLQVGTLIEALPVKGNFVIADKQVSHTVLVAGGIGITPLRAMVHQFISQLSNELSTKKMMSLFYSAKTIDEMCYLDEFTQLAQQYKCFTFYPYISKPANTVNMAHWPGTIGRLSAKQLMQTAELAMNSSLSSTEYTGDEVTFHFYLCGPNAMMDELQHDLILQGVPQTNIHFERFGLDSKTTGEDKFTVKLDGNIEIEFQKQRTLLEAIEQQGVSIESECRTGECGQCKVRLVKGEIKRLIDTDVSLHEREILSCCTVPTTDLVIEV